VDAVAPAKSGAALGGGDAIEVDEAAQTLSKKARTDRRPHLEGFRRASELGFEEFVRRLHAFRVKDALASGKTPPPNTPLLSDRCVPYKSRGASLSGARRATSDELYAGGAGSVAPTLVAATPVGRGSASGAEAGAGAGGAPGKSAPVGGAPPSDTESDKSGRTRAREKRAAGARREAMPRPTMPDLGGAGGGEESEWNQYSGGSVASSSTGGVPTPQHQERRSSGGPRRRGGAGAKKKGPGHCKGKVWTVDEQVALCEAFKLVAQRSDMGADWLKEGLWDTMKEDFVMRIPKSLKPSDLKRRWSERTAGSMQTQFDRKIAPDVQRFAHFFKVVSDKQQLTGGLTEEDLVRAAASLFSGVSEYQAVRQDACSDDERERQDDARAERTGHVVRCACIPMWRVLREKDKFSQAAADTDAVADRFHGIGVQRDVDGGDDGNGGGDKPSREKRPALQPRPDMGVKAAKRMRNNKEDMQESAGVQDVELVRSIKTMEAMVSEAAKRTQLESKRAAAAFFNLAENKATDEAKTLF